jgi:hypothetical protein
MKHFAIWMCVLFLQNQLRANIVTLTASALAGQTNTTQFVVQTNVTAKILHLYNSPGSLAIQVNGLSFSYTQTSLNGAGNNMPIVTGPATIVLSAGQTGGPSASMCTISTESNQCITNQYTPNTGVVIPADSGGPVNIILESSVDLINWIPADPGTYGTSTTNRFFRVRATR